MRAYMQAIQIGGERDLTPPGPRCWFPPRLLQLLGSPPSFFPGMNSRSSRLSLDFAVSRPPEYRTIGRWAGRIRLKRTASAPDQILAVFGDHILQGGDGHLDHAVVRLLGGDMLHPHAGGGNDARDPVFVFSADADELIPHSNYGGDTEKLHRRAQEGVGKGDEKAYDDAEKKHDDHEARPAAGVEPAVFPHVFHCEFLAVFIAENAFVFGPVVLEDPVHIRDLGAEKMCIRDRRHPSCIYSGKCSSTFRESATHRAISSEESPPVSCFSVLIR